MTEHIPVLLTEVLEALQIEKGKKYIDATLGAGGHSREILVQGGDLLAIEADSHMIAVAEERLKPYCPTLVRGNFAKIATIAHEANFVPVDGILMDLGISNLHYEDLKRGFSFRKQSEPLDMRLETETAITAADLLNSLRVEQLRDIFCLTLAFPIARNIAGMVIRAREVKPFRNVSDLVSVVGNDPEVFLALRMVVNAEMDALSQGLKGAYEILKPGGVLAVISFHSGEDRIVKEFLKQHESSEKPVTPTEEELRENPKSRSAKLRILQK